MMDLSSAQRRHHVAPDGVKTVFYYWASDKNAGLPLIGLHGVTRNARDFEGILPDLLASGREVALIDVRGRGLSDFDPDPMRYHLLTYAQDLLGILDQLGWDKALFLGTSMGGLITMTLASFAPDRIGAILFNDIGPQLEEASLEQIRLMLLTQRGPYESWEDATQAVRESNQHAFPDELSNAFWSAFARRLCRKRDDGKIHFDFDPAIARPYENPQPVPDLWPFFDGLPDVSLGLIRGELSALVSAKAAEKMQQHRPGLQYWQVPRVGHAPLLTEPTARQGVIDFLNSAP